MSPAVLLTAAALLSGSLSAAQAPSAATAARPVPATEARQAPLPPGAIQVPSPSGSRAWVTGPPSLPPGTLMLVLEGHPAEAGVFTIRLRLPGDSRIDPHWHSADERVTVLSGAVQVGFGETFDERRMTTFEAGGFYVTPAKRPHFVRTVEPTELQLTGTGPWDLHPVDRR